jgi:hypothetical protein
MLLRKPYSSERTLAHRNGLVAAVAPPPLGLGLDSAPLGLQLPFTYARIVGDGGWLLTLNRAGLGRLAAPPLPLVAMPAGAGVSRDL